MFSIENYITGLIISKVEKFVKNINPNEFKVSLWEGNVVFQNLELKLDVLDEELQLPFTFISGHLQYMKLEIPWTKIATEPITATINDLELVLKLKDMANLPQSRKIKKKKTSVEEDASAGYLASMITKIVNNISIISNNISIKFLEDDIVFSMNVQHLSIYSADSKWKRAFIDVASSTNVIFRKLINIIDLTICLDKRNSLGKIEYVQEPFLYKCSIELRVFRKYNPISPEKHSITRIDLQTKALNINVSSQQFPMLVRLIDLMLALKSGKLQESYGIKTTAAAAAENLEENEESWMSWMWNNIVPTIISDDQQSDDLDINSKKIFEFGAYIENAYVSLKSQELLHDPIIPSAKKAILKPLIEFYFKETYATTVICGRRHFNVKGGVDYVEVKALDNCPCGTTTSEECILKVGKKDTSGKYLIDSYFDKNYKNRFRYEEMFNNYYEKNAEETFLTKVSAIAFDIYHTIEIPDDRGSSDFNSDLEYSNLSENYMIRVFGDGVSINVSSDAIHRVEKLVQYYGDCEFTSYVKEEKIPLKNQLSPATADDYEALINEIPSKKISVKLKNTVLFVKEWNHERPLRSFRKYTRQSSLFEIPDKSCVGLEMKIGELAVTVEVPLYKNRLIYTACQLPDNINNQLFKKCFIIVHTSFKNVMVDMKHNNAKKVCEILKVSSTHKSLIYPHLWEEFDIQQNYFDIEFNGLSFMMNPAQFIVFYRVIISIIQKSPTGDIEKDLLQNLTNSQLVVLQLTSRILKAKTFKLKQAHIAEFTVSDLIGLCWKSGIKSTVLNIPDTTYIPAFFSSKIKNFKSEAMLNVSIQIPITSTTSVQDQTLLTTLMIEMSGGCINLDPLLREFLSFKLFQSTPQRAKELNRTISTSTKPLLTEYSNIQQSSAHSSSEYQETICPSTDITKVNKDLLYYLKMCRNFVVYANLKPVEFYYSTFLLESLKASDSIRDIVQSNGSNTIVLKTPSMSFHSVKNRQTLSKFISPHFPCALPSILWSNDNCLTWNFEMNNLNVYIISNERKKFDIVHNASIKVSLADESHLDEKEVYTGNILIEIFPLYLNLYASQIQLMNAAFNDLSNFTLLNRTKRSKHDVVEINEQENPPNLDLKDFLGLPTGSTITKTSLPEGGNKKLKSNINFYIQWICSKVSLTSIVDTLPVEKKFVLEVDEILFSLHQQEFFQLKCKVTSISGIFFHYVNDKWVKNLNLGFNVQSEENITDTVSRFLDMTVTKAETMNVHSKWNLELKRSNQLILKDVSEINVILQSFDIIASDEIIHFLPIVKLFQRPNDKNQKAFMQYSGSDLPLVHLKCNGFRVFLPNLHKTSNFNVLILKVNGLQITPNAVNNLIRTQILRPDIHSKASHLGVLDLVGSKIEDRQYQLLIKGFSLTSSSWNEITAIIAEKNVENYDNPATIWNNFENGPSSPNFKFYTIFKDSSFSFIYAPCIKFKEVLVAGAAIEINCIDNMNILMSLEQIMLFIDIGNQMKNIAGIFTVNDDKGGVNKGLLINDEKPKKIFDKKSFDDSGVASTISHSNQMKSKKLLSKKNSTVSNDNSTIPFEFTFTSSKFNLNFTIEKKNYSVLLDTPNVYITQNRADKSFNISLYDLKIDYETVNIFTTRHGNIDAISGITPSLVRVKVTEKSFRNSELRIELKRSIFLQITESGIVEFLRVLNILKHHSVSHENGKEIAPIVINSKLRKFDTIKSFMSSFKTFIITTDQIVTEFKSSKNHLKVGLHHLKGKLKLFDRPEKIETNFDFEHLTLQCGDKIFLHPMSIETKAKITQEYWKKEPLIYLNIFVNCIKIDIWPDAIKQFQNFGQSVKSLVGDKQFLIHLNDSDNYPGDKTSDERIQMIASNFKTKSSNDTIEHFLDDLRSGIYTFVEVETPFQELPLPYQIHYQDNSAICWRYPLPRALHKIKVFPVPFQTQNELKIQCRIEYYSQLKSQFEELMSLCLNENETKILDLKPNIPFSEVWRIKFQVNLKRDSDDDEEENEISNYLQMHPKVLLACLRIDSYYKPIAIPSINSLLKISKIQFNLMNENQARHETIKCNIESLQVVSQHYDENCENFSMEGTIAIDVKDYGCDNLIPFVKNFNIKASLDLNHSDINFNLLGSTIRLKYSSAIGHSLITTAQMWKQVLENSTCLDQLNECAKYTIQNNTASTICLNQLNTNEMIYIMPKSTKLYQFYTDKLKQTLQLSVCIQVDEWSEKTEAFNVNQEGIQYVRVNAHQYFIITVKNISNYQRKIIIDGQVLIYNVSKEDFTVQYKRYDKDIDTVDKCEVQALDLSSYSNGSLFGTCEFDSQQTIRLHSKRSEKKIFSGEIPLREIVVNNKPWLVKVPLGTGNFICYWVRIIRQNVNNEICRVLVLICPVFVAKSLFPSDIVLNEEGTNDFYEVKGCGAVTEIEMKGTHENEHRMAFPEQFIQQDKNPAVVTLSYKLVNKNSFFKIPDEYSDISKAIEKIEEKKTSLWPCSRDEEYQTIRNFTMHQKITTLYELSPYEQDSISCSLMLTLIPWSIFINSSGCVIKVTNIATNDVCFMGANDMTIPFYIENIFTVSIEIDGVWVQSEHIYINSDSKKRTSNSYELQPEGTVAINMNHESDTFQLILASTCVGKRRTVFIKTLLIVTNHSNYDLGVIPFCVDMNERIDTMKRNDFPVSRYVELNKNTKNQNFKMGNPITCYSNLVRNKSKRKFGTNYTSFIIIRSIHDNDFSCPIKIQQTLRKCVNVSNGDESVSLCISILKHNDQYYLSIFNDSVPILSIRNNTDFNLYIAQTDLKNPAAKNIMPHREIFDDRFSWFQVISSRQSVFYTPPVFNEHFPEIICQEYGLIFACVSGDDSIRWSMPVKIDETKKIIIHVPMFGDLKLLIDMKKITSEISINYIDSDELVSETYSQEQTSFSERFSSNYQKTFSLSRKKSQGQVMNFNIYLEGITLTFYKDTGERRINLISLSADDIITSYSKQARKLKINFSKLQVDNELFNTGNYDFPVLLCNKDAPKRIDEQDLTAWDVFDIIQRHQSLEKFSIDIDFYENDKHVQNITIHILPIRIYIEDGFISVLVELVEDCLPTNLLYKKQESTLKTPLKNGLVLIPSIIIDQSQQLSKPVRLNSFKLEALHVLLSVHACRRVYIALDHSPLDFSVYEKINIYTVPMKFGNSVGMHYVSSAIFGAGWVVGSLEILGSPSSLTRSFTTGFKDFVSMPLQGMLKGPFGFLVGLTQGSASLFKNVTTGTLNSVTKLANSLARNLDNLTLDNEHIDLKTDALRRSRPQGFTDGLQLGLTGFGINILGAIGGLARHPLQAKSAVDVVTGVGKGILGVFTKPISGIAELVAFMGSGMLQSVGYNVLPNPLSSQRLEDDFSVPNAEKIISKQLPQHISDTILMTCRATYVQKNDLKYAFLILITKSLIIVDLEKDYVTDVILLEKLSPIMHKSPSSPDNLFVFKLKSDNEEEETTAAEKYNVSKRTVQYVKQLSTQHALDHSSSDGDNEIEDEENNYGSISNRLSFYIDETTGKYLLNYINYMKHQASFKDAFFPIFEF